ncbi:MFS transporter [Paenibacillus sp. OAS669]|uniref:MFS transporter n=1 Tax=Paenibacillus sp. OAS669 TaxID=2663821 RepID=UPI001789CFAD|nr:MFS transporter [Paenibacillus sp. OAS669]MBE1444452.1 DHA1 family putative efflux transporter-like MFS transporter [Paenibacillus sp. OAS669]
MNRLSLYLLSIGAFVTGTSELIVAGILPAIADDLGVSVALAGQLITVFSLSFAIGTPVIVALTNRIQRKTALLVSLALFSIGCLCSFMSPGYGFLLGSRIVIGLSAGVYTVIAFGSVAKLVPPEKTGSAIGMIALGISSAMVLGVPLGVAIAKWWSWQAIFAWLAGVSLLVMLGMLWLLPRIEGDAPASFGQQFRVLRNPVIASGLFLSLFMTTSCSLMNTYLTPFLLDILHLPSASLGLMLFALGVSGVIGSRVGGSSVDRWGTKRIISICLSAIIVSLALLQALHSSWLSGISLILIWMFALSMLVPAIQTYFIQQAPLSSNLVLGFNTSILHLGVAVGAGVGGLVVHTVSTVLYHPWLASCIAIVALAIAALSFALSKKNNPAIHESVLPHTIERG